MSDTERAIGRLQGQVETLQGDVKELREDVHQMRQDVRQMQNLVAEVAGALKTMRALAAVFSTIAGVAGYFLHKIWRP